MLPALLLLATIVSAWTAPAAAWRVRTAAHDSLLALLLAVSPPPATPIPERLLLPAFLLSEAAILILARRSRFPGPVLVPAGFSRLLPPLLAAAAVFLATGPGSALPAARIGNPIGIPLAIAAAAAAGLLSGTTDADRAGAALLAANGLLLLAAILPAGGPAALLPILLLRPALILVIRPPGRRAEPAA